MDRRTLAIVLLFALLAVTAAAVSAAPLAQDSVSGLVPTTVSVNPDTPFPGQSVIVIVGYENQATAPVTATVGYKIAIQGPDLAILDEVTGTHEVQNLQPGATGVLTGTIYAPLGEDTYALQVSLDGAALETLLPFVVETALPSELARLFAGLGVFAALMAIMAVGTEVVVEPFKSILGMKQKVTAMEALQELKSELPGQLTGLGVDREQIEEIQSVLDGLVVTLQPVQNLQTALAAIEGGRFGDAFKEIDELQKLWDPACKTDPKVMKRVEAALEAWKTSTIATIRKIPVSLRDLLHLSAEITAPVEAAIERAVVPAIQKITVDDLEYAANQVGPLYDLLLSEVFGPLQHALQDPDWAKRWLDLQTDSFLEGGSAQVEKVLRDNVIDTLRDLGFPQEQLDLLEQAVRERLDAAQRFAQLKMATYTEAVRKLLLAVEERRQEMASPARKLWRNFRSDQTLTLAAALTFLAIAGLGILLAFLPRQVAGSFLFWFPGFPDGLWRLLVAGLGLVLGLIVGAIIQYFLKDSSRDRRKFCDLLVAIEKRFNSWKGDKEPADRYGKVREDDEKRIEEMGPTSVAGVLLKQNDLHRDQETSRLRWLRILSLAVGLLLAYRLNIDAAVYLNYAIPGIEEQINGLVNFAVWHDRWAWFPESLTVGILLTGLAAAAGSKFWRDLLGRLQAARAQSEEAARLVQKVKGLIEVE